MKRIYERITLEGLNKKERKKIYHQRYMVRNGKRKRKDYLRTHREEISKWFKKYRKEKKEYYYKKGCEYRKNRIRQYYVSYLGVQNCPKCGERGYPSLFKRVNLKTGWHMFYICFQHREIINGKQTNVKICDVWDRDLLMQIRGVPIS